MKLNVYGNMPIMTSRDPVVPLEAANKNYVDNSFAAHRADFDLHLTSAQNTFLDSLTVTAAEVNALGGLTGGNIQTQLDGKLSLTGGTMSGYITLHDNPVDSLHAATKSYVDTQDAFKVAKAGDTMTGFLTLSGDPTSALHAVTKQYSDSNLSTHVNDASVHITSAQNALIDAITATATEINYSVGVTSAIQTQLNSKLNLAGGTMTGALVLSGDPTLAMHAATKQYTDAQDALKVAKAGDTMTGALTLSGDPTANLHAATKQYVDTGLSTHASDDALHLTSAQNALIDAITASATEINYTVGVTSAIQTQLNSKLNLSGGTMTGLLTLSASPNTAMQAANKQYVDSGDALKVNKAGDTMTGLLVLSADPVVALGAATKQYVDSSTSTHASNMALHLTSGQNTFLDAITVTATEVNQLAGIASTVQSQLDSKLSKGGGTMTGGLVLAGDPTVALNAATKQYVDAGDALKVAKAGDTMTGALVLSGDPTLALHAAPKQYVDTQDALKVAKAGDTMTGFLTLHADPTANMHAATKQYTDSNLSTHASDATLHLTAGQNTFLDAITVTSTEVNQLAGISSNVQGQIDTKFDIAGGTITGDVTLAAGKAVFVSKVPVGGTELVNKAYVDGLINGKSWEDPISGTDLVNDTLATPPVSPVVGDIYIIGAAPTGAWAGKAGWATFWDGAAWAFIQNRAVAVGDRFGVKLLTATAAGASLTANVGKLVTITDATAGAITYSADVVAAGSTTLVFDPDAPHFGVSYTLTNEGDWVATNTSVNMTAGDGLSFNGNTLNFNFGNGLRLDSDVISVAIDTNSALKFVGSDLVLGLNGTTLTASTSGLKVSDSVMADIADRLSKTATSTVTGDVTFGAAATLKLSFTPTLAAEAVNKGYVDTADGVLQGQITAIDAIVDVLNADPTTKTYVDNQDALKVAKAGDTMTGLLTLSGDPVNPLNPATKQYTDAADALKVAKAGDTMTGFLTLHADPTANLHATTKQYVDTNLSTHATDAALHLTAGQNSFLDAVTASATEVNYLVGVTSGVQSQLNSKLNLAGGTMTGAITLSGDPIDLLNPATKQYTDAADALKVAKAGDTMSGFLTLHADPTSIMHAVTKQYSDTNLSNHVNNFSAHLNFAQNAWLDAITATSTEVNYLGGVTSGIQAQLDSKLNLAGGTMTGLLTLSADPSNPLNPATKQYTDAADALKVAKAGDTMTGFLTLSADPTSALHAATKQYVDSGMTSHTSDASLHLTTAQNALIDALTVTATELNYSVGLTANVQTQLNSKLSLAGGTMTGALVLDADPVASMGAATKQYVDNQDALKVAKAGDTMTGFLTLSADPTNALHAVTKQYSDTNLSSHAGNDSLHLTAGQNTFLDAITVTATEVNYLSGADENIQLQLDSKLNLSGGTLTDFLTLHANPTGNLHAATKGYVDTQDALKVAKAGDTMTGLLTLSGDPTAAMHAATKQYVDTGVSDLTTYVNNQDALKVAKAGDTMTGFLTLHAAPTATLHASTKGYVDSAITTLTGYVDTADGVLQGQITTLQGTVATLNSDPTTKTYVDAQDALKVAKAGDTMTGYLVLHADPLQAMHPATKQYVDAVAQGLSTKPAVRLATTGNLDATYNNGAFGVNATLTANANGALSVDGKTPVVGDRILVRSQTNKLENGDYVVQQVGAAGTPFILKRVVTVDESSEIPGSYFYVYDGDTLKGTGWVFTVDNPITFAIGTDEVAVNQFSGQGSLIAGAGLTITGATIDINTANPGRIVVNADNIDLATTGVTPGTYTKITVDGYGRATVGQNPTTLAGYNIADGQPLNANLTSLSGVSTTGLVVRDATNTMVTKEIAVTGVGLDITNPTGANAGDITINSNGTDANSPSTLVARDASGNFAAGTITAALAGNASTATVLATARDFSATGDATAPAVSFNGSANVALNLTLANSGVTAGTYTKITVDAKGRATAGETPTTIAGLGVQDVYTKAEVDALVAGLQDQIRDLHLYILSRI